LRRAVQGGAANLPVQREALYEIVVHLYLTGDRPPPNEPVQSFMGIELPLGDAGEPGLVPQRRIIGFPAYAALLPGDIVLQIEERPSLEVTDAEALRLFRLAQPPGTTIHLRVLREGEVVRVPLTLATAPKWGGDVAAATEQRLERASAYWETQFEPAFAEGTS
jgi:hypothetical protein